jgi:translocation and assembly module TamB
LGLVAALLLLGLIAAVAGLFYSEPALRWALPRAAALVPGELTVAAVSGRLAGPIVLQGVHYRTDRIELHAAAMTLDWSPLALLRATVRVSSWQVSQAAITLPPESAPPSAPSWFLPWRMEIAGAQVGPLTVRRGRAHLATIGNTELDATLVGDRIAVRRLAVTLDHAELELNGEYRAHAPFPLDVRTVVTWLAPGDLAVAARGRVHGDLERLALDQTFSAPFAGTLRGELHDVLAAARWTATLDVRAFEPARQRPEWPAWTLRGTLRAHGDRNGFESDGTLLAEHARHGRLSGLIRVAADAHRWQLRELSISVPGSAAQLRAQGQWQPRASPPLMLTATWQSLAWPPSGPARLLSRDGHMTLRGAPSDYSVELAGFLTPAPLTELAVDARLAIRAGRYHLPRLRLRSGGAELVASGTLADQWDAVWQGQVAELAGLWPDAAGAVRTAGRVRGPRAQPLIEASLEGSNLRYRDERVAALDASLSLDLQDRQDSRFVLRADDLRLFGQLLDGLRVDADGRHGAHRFSAELLAGHDRLVFGAAGGLAPPDWRGRVTRLSLDSRSVGRWDLAAPVPVDASREALRLGAPLCWEHGDARLCAEGAWRRVAGWEASATATKFPLELLQWLLPEPARLGGTLDGELRAERTARDAITGRLRATLARGTLHYPGPRGPVVVEQRHARLQADATRDRLTGDLLLDFGEPGRLEARFDLRRRQAGGDAPLHGRLLADLRDLRPLALVFPAFDRPQGRLMADLTLSGRRAAPRLQGELSLRDAGMVVPALGVEWRDVALTARATGDRHAQLTGSARSGEGVLRLRGRLDYPDLPRWSARLSIEGENFEVVNTPQAWLLASPQLDLDMRPRALRAGGEVTIPRGRLAPRDLSTAARVSPDTVIVGAADAPPPGHWAIAADLRLRIGERLRVDAFNFGGWIAGDLRVAQEPAQPATGVGELHVVSGHYALYGQKLAVERGTLRFTGGPIDDPALDLRATRRARDVLAGVQARGTLKSPQLTLFSEPALDQSDILSYLLLGRPAREAGGGDNELLYRAATALGFAGGELLARRFGTALGIEDVRIEPGADTAGTSLVLGTYLTPRAYVSYGVGLFEPVNTLRLRYQLGRHWQLEAQSGEHSGGDLLFSIER